MATPERAADTVILLVRHGATPTTGQVLPGRAPGLHLSDAGRSQAEAAAERLAGLPVTALYVSPLERAVETAAPSAITTGLTPIEEPGLLECDFGDWTGEPLAALAELPAWHDLMTAPASFRFPGGESIVELWTRVTSTLERLRSVHAGELVACFSHADPIRVAIAAAMGAQPDAFHRVTVATGSISAIGLPAQTLDDPDGLRGSGADATPVVLTANSLHGTLSELLRFSTPLAEPPAGLVEPVETPATHPGPVA